MGPKELLGADFMGYDAPPAIVAKPGETITLPVFVSHFSDTMGPVKLRWWVSGYDARAEHPFVVEPPSCSGRVAAVRCRRSRAAQGHFAEVAVRRGDRTDTARRA